MKTSLHFRARFINSLILLLSAVCLRLGAQGTAFTYQGRLNHDGAAATGLYDLRFAIYAAASNGSLVAGPLTNNATPVTNGLFMLTMDFGPGVFTGPDLWLQLDVGTNGDGAFTTLTPRQALTATPQAVYAAGAGSATVALTAGTATNLLGILPDTQLSANIPRLNGLNSFAGLNTFGGVLLATNPANLISGVFCGDGSALSGLSYSNFANLRAVPGIACLAATNDDRAVALTNPANTFGGTFNGSGIISNAQVAAMATTAMHIGSFICGSGSLNGTNGIFIVNPATQNTNWILLQ